MVLTVNDRRTEGIYIYIYIYIYIHTHTHIHTYKPVAATPLSFQQSMRSIAPILSRTDQKHTVTVQFIPKYPRPARQLQPEIFAAFRTLNVSAAHITDNNTIPC